MYRSSKATIILYNVIENVFKSGYYRMKLLTLNV